MSLQKLLVISVLDLKVMDGAVKIEGMQKKAGVRDEYKISASWKKI